MCAATATAPAPAAWERASAHFVSCLKQCTLLPSQIAVYTPLLLGRDQTEFALNAAFQFPSPPAAHVTLCTMQVPGVLPVHGGGGLLHAVGAPPVIIKQSRQAHHTSAIQQHPSPVMQRDPLTNPTSLNASCALCCPTGASQRPACSVVRQRTLGPTGDMCGARCPLAAPARLRRPFPCQPPNQLPTDWMPAGSPAGGQHAVDAAG